MLINLIKVLLCLTILLSGIPVWADPAHVQSGYGECYPATTCDVEFGVPGIPGVPVTSGNLLVATIRTDNNGVTCTSVTSQPGNQKWTVDRRQLSVTNFYLEVWSCPNATGGDTTVTVKCSGPPDQMRIVLDEYTGIATSSHVNGTPVSDTDTSATANAGNITTTVSNALIHSAGAADGNDDADTFTPGPGYTIHYLGPDPAGSDKTMTQHRVAATAGSYGTTMGRLNDSWAAVAVAYAPSGGADNTPPTLSSFVVQPAGTSVVATFNEMMTESGIGSDWSYTMSGGVVTLSNPSVNGSAITYTTSRTINYDETLSSLSYEQPGNGIEDIADNDLVSIADASGEFDNQSSYGAQLTYHWVSTTGTAEWESCVGATDPGVYCSLGTANSNLSASSGQNIVYLKAGTYNSNNERINPSNSGTSSYPLTYQSSGGTVTITGAACNGGSEYAVELTGNDYIIVNGISATGCDMFLYINGSDYNEISNCSFDDSDDGSWPSSAIYNSDYNWIHNTRFSKGGSADRSGSDHGSCLDIGDEGDSGKDSNYNLIEDCAFFHGGHHVVGLMASRNTFRNNYIHNEAWTNGYGNRNLYNNSPSGAAGNNVIEGNRWGYAWQPVDGATVGNVVIGSPSNIYRYNSIYHSNAYAVALFGYNGYSNATDNRLYNNTFFNNGLNVDGGQNDCALLIGNLGWGQTPTGNVMRNNLYYSHNQEYAGDAVGTQTYANEFTSGNPLFTNASTTPPADKTDAGVPDLTLTSGSPAINAGGALTTIAAADTGSGRSLIVSDANYFQDGSYAPPGKSSADWIAVGTVGNTVQISSISGNTITLSNSISRNDGDSVWLYKKSDGAVVLIGDAPDAGAYEFSNTNTGKPSPPINLRIVSD